jgi:hypothetical protein
VEGRQPGDYYHDGFYLRLALGMSYGWLAGTGPLGSASLSGNGPAFAIAAGGTPARGLVLALSLMIGSVNGVLAGAPPASTGSVTSVEPVLGALVDWYPRPEHGWHVGGSLGLGGVGVTDAPVVPIRTATLSGSPSWVATTGGSPPSGRSEYWPSSPSPHPRARGTETGMLRAIGSLP